LHSSDITEELFGSCLYSNSVPDMLIRTSGETRLSDFLLWQSSFSCIAFFSALWPEFSPWHLFYTVFLFQRKVHHLKRIREFYAQELEKHQLEVDTAYILRNEISGQKGFDKALQTLRNNRKARTENFMNQKSKSDLAFIESLLEQSS